MIVAIAKNCQEKVSAEYYFWNLSVIAMKTFWTDCIKKNLLKNKTVRSGVLSVAEFYLKD